MLFIHTSKRGREPCFLTRSVTPSPLKSTNLVSSPSLYSIEEGNVIEYGSPNVVPSLICMWISFSETR